jgi:hypothetical protein
MLPVREEQGGSLCSENISGIDSKGEKQHEISCIEAKKLKLAI